MATLVEVHPTYRLAFTEAGWRVRAELKVSPVRRELEAVEEEGDGGERGVGPGLGVRQQVVELGLGGVTLESSLCASARISRGGEGSLSWGYFLWGLLERLLTVKFRLTSSRGSSSCSLEPSSWNMSSINCLT